MSEGKDLHRLLLVFFVLLAGCGEQPGGDAAVPAKVSETPTANETGRYIVKREIDGPFSFSISGVRINQESTLQRESILFNDPTCPVSISSNRMTFGYEYRRRGIQISSATALNLAQPIVALEVRHILFDVFGRHMGNLANLDVQDFKAGSKSLEAAWNIFDENEAAELLTTVTYVARARLQDGTQWVFNENGLTAALGTLHLEKKIGDDAKPPESANPASDR